MMDCMTDCTTKKESALTITSTAFVVGLFVVVEKRFEPQR